MPDFRVCITLVLQRLLWYTVNNMKFWLAIVTAVSFVSIAVLGIYTMNHGGEPAHSGCLAATANGAPCRDESNAWSFLALHLDAFKSFSIATMGSSLAFFLVILTILVSFVYKVLPRVPSLTLPLSCTAQKQRPYSSEYPNRLQFIHWLALHENSPSVA